MTLDEGQALQKAYVRRRRAWGRKINRPYRGHETEPPATADLSDPELG